jgi:hypothetical protein
LYFQLSFLCGAEIRAGMIKVYGKTKNNNNDEPIE